MPLEQFIGAERINFLILKLKKTIFLKVIKNLHSYFKNTISVAKMHFLIFVYGWWWDFLSFLGFLLTGFSQTSSRVVTLET